MQTLKLHGAGVMLAVDVAGPADGPPLLFLHGSGQTRQSWRKALEEAASRGYRAMAADLRGHGDSDWSPDGKYTLDVFAADAKALAAQLGGQPILVGASLGGIIGMLLCEQSAQMLRALVLVDIVARVETQGTKEIVAFMDSAPDGFASLEEAADAVAAYLPGRPRPKDSSGLLRNLRLKEDGRYHWHWDPAFGKMGANVPEKWEGPNPLERAARAVKIPTLLVRGGKSRVVSAEGVREFLEHVPHAEFIDIASAHHMVVGDANDAFNAATFDFIERQISARTL